MTEETPKKSKSRKAVTPSAPAFAFGGWTGWRLAQIPALGYLTLPDERHQSASQLRSHIFDYSSTFYTVIPVILPYSASKLYFSYYKLWQCTNL